MSKLIEKMSYEAQNDKLVEVLKTKVGDGNVLAIMKLQEYIAEQVELAYQAGYKRFNAITHECVEFKESEGMEARWHELEEEFPLLGPDSQLPSIYSQSKGFKP